MALQRLTERPPTGNAISDGMRSMAALSSSYHSWGFVPVVPVVVTSR